MKITHNLIALSLVAFAGAAVAQDMKADMKMSDVQMAEMKGKQMSGMFMGIEAKTGSVSLYKMGGKYHLQVSKDFKVPASPAPHWQVVDAKGNTFLLQRFNIVGDKINSDIVLPSYITSVAKVQVWCSFAEVNLGEAKFAKVVHLK
ncbi:MAG TPA: hypothetical protein VK171_04125 [Fimbriimonas sp.]|nr:hypothetical protein [Fimbriimonas sp.]